MTADETINNDSKLAPWFDYPERFGARRGLLRRVGWISTPQVE
jgi:hypothetical protein